MAADPDQLAQAARSLDERLRQGLPGQGVKLYEFESLEELQRGLAATP